MHDRLVQAGLEDFCLELHSTKAGRKETAAALARRLGRSGRPRSSDDLPSALARLKTLRNGLARYVEALAQSAGKLGITAQELLWRCHTVRQQSSSLPSEIDELVLSDVNELTEIDIGRLVSVVDQFERRALVLLIHTARWPSTLGTVSRTTISIRFALKISSAGSADCQKPQDMVSRCCKKSQH